MKHLKLTIFTILMLGVTALLVLAADSPLFSFSFFDSPVVNNFLNYQLTGLLVAGLALLITFVFADKIRLGYLNFTRRRGKMLPLLPGQKKENGARWETDAWVIGLSMVALMGTVAFLQTVSSGYNVQWLYILMAIPLAASNAFIEGVIFRLSYVIMGDNQKVSRWYGLLVGSLVFGFIHYWGVAPNGLSGALMSFFLGYFLAKSIQETKGFFWSFAIHFSLDVIILLFIFSAII